MSDIKLFRLTNGSAGELIGNELRPLGHSSPRWMRKGI